ncbi:polyketide beta-ketoacyl-synthase [Tilletia horrida]|uniref:Polyketide beta-ketoacyl-synthase n=1 Tax=Tilletia horrida TaxID=155126 RepID=A0AAN6JSF9_9BASI|nr:polyketide beta-ketoacyl-synthase [Tilletia horrida]
MSSSSVLVFGPQGTSPLPHLQHLIARAKTQPLLSAFFDLVAEALLADVDALPAIDLASLPPRVAFKSIANLVRRHERDEGVSAAVNGALICATNLAQYLASVEEDSELGRSVANAAAVSGYCTGFLAAAVVALDPTPAAVLRAGVEAVRLSFFIGLRSDQISRELVVDKAADTATALPWSYILLGVEMDRAEELVKTFNERQGVEGSASLFISAVTSPKNISVSGPPALLQVFASWITGPASPIKDQVNCSPIKITCAYHSPELGPEIADAVKTDVESRNITIFSSERMALKLYSTDDGKQVEVGQDGDLLQSTIANIVSKMCRWDLVADAITTDALAAPKGVTTTLVNIAFSGALIRELQMAAAATQADVPISVIDLFSRKTAAVPSASNGASITEPQHWPSCADKDDIAVISIACRFPGAQTPEQYWDLLQAQKQMITEIPKDRFDIDAYYGSGRNQTQVRHMGAISDADKFDCRFFNISPKEAEQKDPGHRAVMLCCTEALNKAGYAPDATPSFDPKRIGCWMGASSDDYRENASSAISSCELFVTRISKETERLGADLTIMPPSDFITGNIRAFVPGTVSFYNKWEGPSNSVDTGDSSSLTSLEHAINALRANQCDAALAGGVTYLTQPQMFIGLDKDGLLSHSGHNYTFGSNNDGTVRGEGVGVILLKRLSDAIAEKDNVLAILSGAGSAFSNDEKTEKATMTKLYRETAMINGIPLSSIVHVEASGHHTCAGEALEAQAIADAYSPKGRPITIGSVRPNIGACEAASGMASVIKAILALHNGKLPAQTGVPEPSRLNSAIAELEAGGKLQIPRSVADLPEIGQPRVIAINNSSIQHGHSVLFVKEAPIIPQPTTTDPRTAFPFVIAGKTASALANTRDRFVAWLSSAAGKAAKLSDISVTMTARRITTYPFRLSCTASTREELIESLKSAKTVEVGKSAGKVGFVFMGVDGDHAAAQLNVSTTFKDTAIWCKTQTEAMGFPNYLAKPEPNNARVRLFAVQMALLNLYKSWGIVPDVVAAQGLGIFTAAVAARALDVRTAIFLLNQAFVRPEALSKIPVASLLQPIQTEIMLPDGKIIEKGSQSLDVLAERLTSTELITSSSPAEPKLSPSFTWLSVGVEKTVPKDRLPTVVPSEPTWTLASRSVADLYKANITVNWGLFHREFLDSFRMLEMPTYAFDMQRFWIEYQDRNLLGHDDVDVTNEAAIVEEETEELESSELSAPSHSLLSACVRFELEDGNKVVAEYETPLADPLVMTFVAGHLVHGRGLVPATVWAEMALEVACDLSSRSNGGAETEESFEVRDLTMVNGLTLRDEDKVEDRLIVVSASGSLGPDGSVAITFKSRNPAGTLTDHLTCSVASASSANWQSEWKRVNRLVTARATGLKKEVGVISTRIAYERLFKVVVEYQPCYQGMKAVYLSADTFEACTEVMLNNEAPNGNFIVNPCLMDSLGQITGFVSNIAGHKDGCVYIANNVESMRFSPGFRERASADPHFTTYCQMSLEDGFCHGDVYFMSFATGEILGMMGGVRFRQVPLRVLEIMLPPKGAESKAASKKQIVKSAEPVAKQASVAEVPKPVAKPAAPAAPSLFKKCCAILVAELGVEESDLSDDADLADLGLDSLMSLVVLGQIRAESTLDIPNDLFLSVSTPGELKSWLASHGDAAEPAGVAVPETSAPKEAAPAAAAAAATQVEAAPAEPSGGAFTEAWEAIKEALVTELGVTEEEVEETSSLADLGVDSLLAMVVLGALRNVIDGVEFPNDLFLKCDSAAELKEWLASQTGADDSGATTPTVSSAPTLSEFQGDDTAQSVSTLAEEDGTMLKAPSITWPDVKVTKPILLQPGKRPDKQTIFLAPDGSGSSAVYVGLPELGGARVYALNSPFLRDAKNWTGGMEQLARWYLDSMRLVQPKGPYILGGWSFGGIISYYISCILCESEEPEDRISTLLLCDSPCPINYPALPLSIVDWIFGTKAFEDIAPPALTPTLLEHFRLTVDGLAVYKPMCHSNPGKIPKTSYISSQNGLGGKPEDVKEYNPTVTWLQNSRRGRGVDGWDELLGKNVSERPIETDHFRMMRKPDVEKLAAAIIEAWNASS